MPHVPPTTLRSRRQRRRVLSLAALTATASLTATALAMPSQAATSRPPGAALSQSLANQVTLTGLNRHLVAFQRFADTNGGTRAAGTPGYDASAAYAVAQWEAAGLDVSTQEFVFPYFEELSPVVLERVSPSPRTYVPEEEVITATYAGAGDVTAQVVPVAVQVPPPAAAGTTTSGCSAEDFAGFPVGAIALIQRGTCTFAAKAANAAAAGAGAVILFNEGQEGRTAPLAGTLGAPSDLPVVGISYADGAELAQQAAAGPVTARVAVDTISEERTTRNVIAETKGGRADNVVMLGAHLDSVPEGPGINDNGSGSAAIIELGRQIADEKLTNKVRLALWSAEELGLLGAEHYVSQLSFEQQLDISMYLNFDMIGSPNFARFVYDGDDSDRVGAGPGPFGSAQIESALRYYISYKGFSALGTDFDGRSDYGPFIAVGIPSGGTFTGAEGIKTPEQARLFGGTAGVAFDPNYHQPGDTLGNVNRAEFDRQADLIAAVAARYATSTTEVNGVSGAAAKDSAGIAAQRGAGARVASAPAGDAGFEAHGHALS